MPRLRGAEWLVVAYVTAASVVGAVFFARRSYANLRGASLFALILWQSFGYLLWAALVPLLARFRSTRVVAAAGAALIPAHALATACWTVAMHPARPRASIAAYTVERLPIDALFYLAIIALLHARRAATAAAEERAATAEARLEAVAARIKPHFLFNSLQGIVQLIETDPPRAAAMTRRLAELLRMTLQAPAAGMTTLRREMEIVDAYLAIQRERFPSIEVASRIDPDALDVPLPLLLLQPLVENAVTHGLEPRGEGSIEIAAQRRGGRLHLEISDDGGGLPSDLAEGIGLSATRERLRAIYGSDHRFSIAARRPRGTRVVLEVPA